MSEEKKELREREGRQEEPFKGTANIGKDVLNLAETFGIKKSDVGKAVIKYMLGKDIHAFFYGDRKNESRSKFEKTLAAIKDLMIPIMVFYMIYTFFRAWCAFQGVII